MSFNRSIHYRLILALFLDDRSTPTDEDFVYKVKKDVEHYVNKSTSTKRVLLFPPFPSHYRFLIHKVIEECDPDVNLCSLSVGNDAQRRTVIYFGSAKKANESAMLKGNNSTIVGRSASQQLPNNMDSADSKHNMRVQDVGSAALRGRNRRPDKQLYVPKAKRLGDAQEKDAAIDASPQQPNRKVLSNMQKKQVEGLNKENSSNRQNITNASTDKCQHDETAIGRASKITPPCSPRNTCEEPIEIGVPETKMCKPDVASSTNSTIVWRNREPIQSVIVQSSNTGDVQSKTEINRLQATEFHIEDDPSLVAESPTTNCAVFENGVESRSSAVEVKDTPPCAGTKCSAEAVIKPNQEALTEVSQDLSMQQNKLTEELENKGPNSVEIHPKVHLERAFDETCDRECPTSCQLDENLVEMEESASSRTIVLAEPHNLDLSSSPARRSSGDASNGAEDSSDAIYDVNSNGAEDSWDAIYDDNGECLDHSVLTQLTSAIGEVSIEVPQIDYLSFQTKEPQITDDDFGHVVEIYNFPVEFKTEDLMSAFSHFKDRGFNIKWVNDTHALAVFSSRMAAEEALMLRHPIISTRPLSQGIKESKLKARRCAEFLQPYKPRPETSALLARRLVAGALGVHLPVSKQEREEDRRKLREAKERKRLAVKQREEAWEGIIGNDQ